MSARACLRNSLRVTRLSRHCHRCERFDKKPPACFTVCWSGESQGWHRGPL